jgi:hypothetical protein
MEFIFFPDPQIYNPQRGEFKDQVGDVGKEIKDLSKHHRDLYLRVKTFLEALRRSNDISPYLRSEQIYKFPKDHEGLYEMRIPKQAQGGVFRIYFCMSLRKLNTLILLCAELKHKTKPMKLETAMQKMNQYKELVKQGVMS